MAYGPMIRVARLRRGQDGYALLLAMGALFGMLALILPLARLHNDQIQVANDQVDDAKAQWIIESGRNLARYAANQSASGKSRFQRTAMLPGWEDYPIRMKLSGAMNTSQTTVPVANMLPLVMQLSKRMGITSAFLAPGSSSIGITEDTGNPTYSSDFLIVNGELIKGTTRGVAGTPEAHPAGSVVYAVFTDALQGYVRVDNEWMRVSGINSPAASRLAGDLVLSKRGDAGSSVVAHTSGAIVEFYPAYPNLRAGKIEGYVRIDVDDERAKINANTLTSQLSQNIFGATLWSATTLSTSNPRTFPMAHPDGIMQCITPPPQLREYALSILTSYSDPDYGVVQRCKGADTTTLSLPGSQSIVCINSSTSPTLPSPSVAENRIPTHPVNFNRASMSVMAEVLTGLGGLSSTDAGTLARKIEAWRSGEPNTINQEPDYLDGNEDPFDGVSSNTGTSIHYGSPQEEFLACISHVNYGNHATTTPVYQSIRKHVYFTDFRVFYSQNPFTAPICFETGNVKSLKSTVGIMRSSNPGMVKYETTVLKDVVQTSASSAGNIVITLGSLDGGWNEGLSTFHGLSADRPVCFTGNVGNILDIKCTAPPIAGKVLGHYDSSGNAFGLTRRMSNDGTHQIFETTSPTSLTTGIPMDFGLHFASSNCYSIAPSLTMTANTAATLVVAGNLDQYPSSGILILEADGTSTGVLEYSGTNGTNTFTGITPRRPASNWADAYVNGGNVSYYPFKAIANGWTVTNDHIANNATDSNFYYETILVRDGAVWETLHVTGITMPGVSVEYKFFPNNAFIGGSPSMNLGNVRSDTLYIRLTFSRGATDFSLLDSPSPQVFGIQAAYRLAPGARANLVLQRQ